MKKNNLTATLLLCLCLASCNRLDIKGMFFGSSPAANERFAESRAYNEANGFETVHVRDNEYTVYVATDAHVASTAENIGKFVSGYLSDETAAPFAIFLGDATDDKDSYGKFLRTVAPIGNEGRRLFCIPGNHDIFFGLWKEYIEAQKTASYCFTVVTPSDGTDLFICLDSASGTLGTDQRDWLGEIFSSAKGKYRRIIVLSHTHFFKRDNSQGHTSNFNQEEGYELEKLFSDNGVSLVLSGHDHSFEETVFKNVRYLTLAAIADKEEDAYYYKITVNSRGTEWSEQPI